MYLWRLQGFAHSTYVRALPKNLCFQKRLMANLVDAGIPQHTIREQKQQTYQWNVFVRVCVSLSRSVEMETFTKCETVHKTSATSVVKR